MPSRSGWLLATKLSTILMRKLTTQEVLQCEEIAFNYYPGALLAQADKLSRQPIKHTFDMLCATLLRVNGAKRGLRQHELRGTLLDVYRKMDLFRPRMSDNEMKSVIVLADKYTSAEIDRGIMVARARGIQSVQYVLGICVGNIGKPTDRVKKPIELFEDDVLRPDPEDVADAWALAADAAQDKLRMNIAERAANDGITKR